MTHESGEHVESRQSGYARCVRFASQQDADRQEAEAILAQMRDNRRNEWTRRAPNDIAEMLRSPDETFQRLRHPSANVRLVAVDVLSYHWQQQSNPIFTQHCERISVAGRDPLERQTAILALGKCFRGTDDVRVAALLARIACSEKETHDIRQAAYMAIVDVREPDKTVLFNQFGEITNLDSKLVMDSFHESRVPAPYDPLGKVFAHLPANLAAALAHCRRGHDAFGKSQHDVALQAFSEALDCHPNLPGIFIARGQVLMELKRFREAIADLSQALELSPTSAVALQLRAHAYRATGDLLLAERDEHRLQGL